MSQPEAASLVANSPTKLVLSDWAADVEAIASDRDSLIYELLISALMYDTIYIQDEAVVLSDKLTRWFGDQDGLPLLKELLNSGVFVFLTLPRWPSELVDLAYVQPMLARARYLEKYGAKNERPFRPTDEQLQFYSGLDSFLKVRRHLLRPAGSEGRFELIPTFGEVLKQVLTNNRYKQWIVATFGNLDESTRDDFILYATQPEKARERIRMVAHLEPGVAYATDGRLLFTRALAYQAAATYPPDQAQILKWLTQSAFAAAFCANEDSAGRYAGILKELVLTQDSDLELDADDEMPVRVERITEIPLGLPALSPDLVRAVLAVRDLDAGQNLRAAVRESEKAINDDRVERAWREVAETLAQKVVPAKQIAISSVVAVVLKEVVKGYITAWGPQTILAKPSDPIEALWKGVLGAFVEGVYHGGRLLGQVRTAHLEHEKIHHALETALKIRCVEVGVAPFTVVKRELQAPQ